MQFEPRDFQDTVYRVCTYQGNIQGAAGEKKQLVYKEAVPNEHDTRIHTLVIILGALSFKSNSGCLRTHPSFQHWLGSYSTMSQRTKNRPRLIAHTAHRGLKDIWKQDYTMQKKMLQQIEELTINLRFKHPFGNTPPPHTHTLQMVYFQVFSRTQIFENRVVGTYLSPPMEMQGLDKLTGVQLPLRCMG